MAADVHLQDHQKSIFNRLRRLEGQIRGLQRMVEEQKDCEQILMQLLAAKSALNQVGVQVVTHSMMDCLTANNPDSSPDELIGEAMSLFARYVEALK
jgi:CsoR family transcriptional regulator, copper-sensing transcriptional repressor